MAILKIIFFSFLLFQAIHGRNDCPSRVCGDNPSVIRFPFRLQGQQPENCGYPGFDLNCTSQSSSALLNLPYSGDFSVRNINYLIQEIKLYDPNGCLPRRLLLTLNLSSSPFTSTFSRNLTFISCPIEFLWPTFATIDCLSNSTSSVLATSSLNLAKAMNMCSIIVTLPIPVLEPPVEDDEWLSSDHFNDLLLSWNLPDCEDCEVKGNTCGFSNSTSNQIMCFTDPVTGKSRVLKIIKIVALSIIIPSITCLVCVSCLVCIMEWRRNFHPFPANTATSNSAPPLSPTATISGLDDSIIESYTKLVLGGSRRLPGPNGTTCPICLVDYHPNDTLRCMPHCEHCFHSDCVDEWLRMNSTCPICRNAPSPARANT